MRHAQISHNLIGIILPYVLIAVVLVLYWPGLNGPFLLDDQNNISPLAFKSITLDSIIDVVSHNTSGLLGRPISVLSLALTQHFSGASSFAFKYTNLMIHCLIGLLLAWLTGRILLTLYPQDSKPHTWAVAFVVAFLWLIHPLNVSTVLYAVQRMAQLSMLFTIVGLLCFVIGRQALIDGRRSAFWLGSIGAGIAFLLSVFSKENGALFPLYLGALEVLVFSKKQIPERFRTDLIVFRYLWIILPLICGAIYLVYAHSDILGGYQNRNFDLPERLLTQVHVIFFYLRMILLPRLKDMSLYHDDFPISTSVDITTTLLASAIIAMIAVAYIVRHKHPLISLGIAWFFISHLMESTFIPLEMVFEHRNYPAIYGLLLPIVYYVIPAQKNSKVFKRTRITTLIFMSLLLCTQTALRTNAWAKKDTLLLVTAHDHPKSSRVHSELANLFFLKHDIAGGLAQLELAEKLTPFEAGVNLHQILVSCQTNNIPHGLIEKTKQKLANNIFTPYALSGIDVLIQRKMGNQCDPIVPTEITSLVERAIDGAEKGNSIADQSYLYMLLARTYLTQGKFDLAMKNYDKSYNIMPKSLRPLIEKADLQIGQRKLKEAQITINTIKSTKAGRSITEKHNIDKLQHLMDTAISLNNNTQPAATGAAPKH